MEKFILFNHIPKTGGTTLRIILNKVYSIDNVYFIESKNLGTSLQQYFRMQEDERKKFKVIAGHGAFYYVDSVSDSFKITILRNPIDLFISQYYYLRESPNSVFRDKVSHMESIKQYIPFAIENGQDNLMTRYLSNSIDWLIDGNGQIPDMSYRGTELLESAKKNLYAYDAILSLDRFDQGIYSLKKCLDWKTIPLYRHANRTKDKQKRSFPEELKIKLNEVLHFDIELYRYFIDKKLDICYQSESSDYIRKIFLMRQKIINKISR